jgi:hypothetical protein
VDSLVRAAAPEEEGGRGMTLDKKANRRIVLVPCLLLSVPGCCARLRSLRLRTAGEACNHRWG